MPVQMGAHADTLRTLGLSYDPKQLTDPLAHPLGAIVWLGGCSASFVSKTGLIITNHHCIQSALQYNNGDANLIENGYLAKSPAEELWAGPGSHVFVTTAFTDVTSTVLKDIEKIEGDEARYEEIKKRINDLTEACEVGKTDTRCQVSSFLRARNFFKLNSSKSRTCVSSIPLTREWAFSVVLTTTGGGPDKRATTVFSVRTWVRMANRLSTRRKTCPTYPSILSNFLVRL